MMQKQYFMSTAQLTREEWLQARKNGIGGSDAASIMGDNPWRGPLAVYADKLDLTEERESSEAMRQGVDLEDYVAKRFCEETDKKVRRVNHILQHREHEWMLANVDRMVVGENAGLECKTTSVYNRSDFEGGEVPRLYQWQCQHYMAVTGCERWYLAVLVLSKAFHVFQIDRDDALIERLTEAERAFWHDHVLKKVPPYATAAEGDTEALNAVYAESMDEMAYLGDASLNALEMLKLYKADKKKIEDEIAGLEGVIKANLGAAERAEAPNWRVTWKPETRRTIDGARFRSEMPDLAAKYTKENTTRVLRIKEVKTNG